MYLAVYVNNKSYVYFTNGVNSTFSPSCLKRVFLFKIVESHWRRCCILWQSPKLFFPSPNPALRGREFLQGGVWFRIVKKGKWTMFSVSSWQRPARTPRGAAQQWSSASLHRVLFFFQNLTWDIILPQSGFSPSTEQRVIEGGVSMSQRPPTWLPLTEQNHSFWISLLLWFLVLLTGCTLVRQAQKKNYI